MKGIRLLPLKDNTPEKKNQNQPKKIQQKTLKEQISNTPQTKHPNAQINKQKHGEKKK